MTYDPYRNDFSRDPNLYVDNPPSALGSLGFLVLLLALLGGGAYFISRNDDVKSAFNQPRPNVATVTPPITQPETTGSAPAR